MEQVQVKTGRRSNRAFVGRAWKNTSRNGVEYVNLSFDRGLEVVIRDKNKNVEYVIPEGGSIMGFPNEKREGKKDADLRFSIQLEN